MSKDDIKGKLSKNQTHAVTKHGACDAFHDDIHVLELKEAAKHCAQKNAIWLKKLELQEKRHEAKVRKMEMDAEIQKAHLNMLNNVANMFASGSMGTAGGIHAANHVESELSTLDGSTTTESWVHSQQQVSAPSSSNSQSSQMGVLPGLANSKFNFSTNDLHFPSSWKPGNNVL